MTRPVTPADAMLGPAEEQTLLKQVVWPSHEPLAFLRRRGGMVRGYGLLPAKPQGQVDACELDQA